MSPSSMQARSVQERLHALLTMETRFAPGSEPRKTESKLLLELQPLVSTYNTFDLRKLTSILVGSFEYSNDYQTRLDQGLSGLIQLSAPVVSYEHTVFLEHKATNIIKRLPATPTPTTYTMFLRHCRLAKATGVVMDDWESQLAIASASEDFLEYNRVRCRQDEELLSALVKDWSPCSNTLSITLAIADSLECPIVALAQTIKEYVSFLAALGGVIMFHNFHLSEDQERPIDIHVEIPVEQRQEILTVWEIYVSICWQHSRMLLYYYILGAIFRYGWTEEWASLFDVSTLTDFSESLTARQPKYLCSQALELLYRSKGSVRLYSRTLFDRFSTLFAHYPARCDPSSPTYVCDGAIPRSCTRFHSQSTPDQFMHDVTCNGDECYLVTWDEESYDLVNGGSRAVDFYSMAAGSESTHLLYRQADDNTMAISHVWSHGQGGRPETGINSCLLNRYATIARIHHCSSFWIDTCCIPTDNDRRMEAIKGINKLFTGSKITLVCDKDLMTVPANSSEDVLAVLLVADWNVRAWTLLEGLKGRDRLHLLCAGNAIVSFSTLCRDIFENGAIDLVIHLTAVQHLLPKFKLSYEESGFMLGRRTASRVGDETIIWELMSIDQATKSAEDIVKHLDRVKTGFLMSMMPRIQRAGLSWAPRVTHDGNDFSGSDGDGSETATVTKDGLDGHWLVHHIDNSPKNRSLNSMDQFYMMQLALVRALTGVIFDGARPPGLDYRHLILIHAKQEGSDEPYFGRNQISLWRSVGLCGSHDRVAWKWLAVLSLDTNITEEPLLSHNRQLRLDDFGVEQILLS